MIVLDASAVLELLLGAEHAAAVQQRIGAADETLHAPHLLDIEVTQVVRRYCLFEGLSAERGSEALQDLAALDVQRYPHEPLLERVWELRENLTAYDAAYVALAEALGAVLLTCDARLLRASGHHARVEVV